MDARESWHMLLERGRPDLVTLEAMKRLFNEDIQLSEEARAIIIEAWAEASIVHLSRESVPYTHDFAVGRRILRGMAPRFPALADVAERLDAAAGVKTARDAAEVSARGMLARARESLDRCNRWISRAERISPGPEAAEMRADADAAQCILNEAESEK